MRWEPCLCGDPECPQCYPGVTEEALEELREVDNATSAAYDKLAGGWIGTDTKREEE